MRSSKRLRLLALVAAVALTTLSGLAPASAGNSDDRIVLSQGHTDALDVHHEGGQLSLKIKDDTGGPPVVRDPADVLFQALPGSAVTVPENPTFAFLGNPGDTVHVLPMTQNQSLLWPGWSTERLSSGVFQNNRLDFKLLSVDGPGRFVLYQTAGFGSVIIQANSNDGLPDTWTTPTGSHVHANWAFGALGRYTLTFEVSGTLLDGTPVTTRPVAYEFHVGDLPADPATTLSITGMQSEYEPGDTVTLTAVQDPPTDLDHYHWFVKVAGDDTFRVISGAGAGAYSFTATEELHGAQYLARLYGDGHTVVAESPPVTLNVDAPDIQIFVFNNLSHHYHQGGNINLSLTVDPDLVPGDQIAWEWRWPGMEGWLTFPGISGTQAKQHTLTAEQALHGVQLRATLDFAADGKDSIVAPAVTIAVDDHGAAARQQPTVAGDTAVTVGDQVELGVELPANGPTVLDTYRWERKAPGGEEFDVIDGMTGATLSFAASLADDGAEYRVSLVKPNGSVAYGPSPAVALSVGAAQTAEEAAAMLRNTVAGLELDASQAKLVRFLDRIDREVAARSGGEACRAVDSYVAEIVRLASQRPERNPLPADTAALLTELAGGVATALDCHTAGSGAM